jgi:hypothetical protein
LNRKLFNSEKEIKNLNEKQNAFQNQLSKQNSELTELKQNCDNLTSQVTDFELLKNLTDSLFIFEQLISSLDPSLSLFNIAFIRASMLETFLVLHCQNFNFLIPSLLRYYNILINLKTDDQEFYSTIHQKKNILYTLINRQ